MNSRLNKSGPAMGQGLAQKQTLGVSLRMRQFLRMVQLSNQELSTELQQSLAQNPLLEIEGEDDWAVLPEATHDHAEGDNEGVSDLLNTFAEGENGESYHFAQSAEYGEATGADYHSGAVDADRAEKLDSNWQEDTQDAMNSVKDSEFLQNPDGNIRESDNTRDINPHDEICRGEGETIDPIALLPTKEDPFADIREGALSLCENNSERMAVRLLLGYINEHGLLEDNLREVATHTLTGSKDYPVDDGSINRLLALLEKTLPYIQAQEPAGFGARSVQECLCLQVNRWPDSDTKNLAITILQSHYDVLIDRSQSLQKALGIGVRILDNVLFALSNLTTRPGEALQEPAIDYVIADVLVKKGYQGWVATLNSQAIPSVRINRQYARWLKKERNAALEAQLQNAKNLIADISSRSQMILAVASYLVEAQRGFFELGPSAMRPILQKDLARHFDLHPSTVSRVVDGKYLQCPRGIFPFSYFLDRGKLLSEGGNNLAKASVNEAIQNIIAQESPLSPLSDDEIVSILQNNGIKISRRSVSKYRAAHNIPSSYQRRKKFAPLHHV